MARTRTSLITLFLAIGLMTSVNLFGQDTAAVVKLREVEITEARLSEYAIGATTTHFDSAILTVSQTGSLADLLNEFSTTHIKAHGNGMLSSISFRGTGPEHTAVLWHGINISYPMLGQTDFSLLPMALNDQVLVQHGTGSSLYGSGALGGTIALGSARPHNGKQVSFGQWLGSFGTVRNNGKLSLATDRYFIKLLGSWMKSANDFVFRNTTKPGTPTETQEHAAFNQLALGLESGVKLTEHSKLLFSAQYLDMARQIQPTMNVVTAGDTQDDKNLRFRTRYSYANTKTRWYLQYAYLEDEINFNGARTRSSQHVVRANLDQQLSGKLKVSLAADHSLVGVAADFYTNPEVNEYRTNIWASVLALPTPWLTLSANLRQAFHPVYSVPLSPSLGAEMLWRESATGQHLITLMASRGFRIPTLNELYWQPGGNLDLVPEDSYSLEAGLKGSMGQAANLSYQVTAYRMWVANWILWRPSANFWAPENIRQVDVHGLELSGSLEHSLGTLNLAWRGNYAFTRSVNQTGLDQFDRSVGKQLSYTPVHKGGLAVDGQYRTWSLMLNGVAIGQRYITADNENALPAYFLLNLRASKQLEFGSVGLRINASLNNLLNVEYQSVANRAMPGVNYLVGVNINFIRPE